MIRLFAALQPPPEIAEQLSRRQAGLPGARWRPKEAMHITLRFFGEISETAADDLDAELGRVKGPPLTVELSGAGAFDEGGRVHAVWAGVVQSAPLAQLARRCEAAARRAGLKADRRAWLPHITLAYLNRGEAGDVAAWIQAQSALTTQPFRVRSFGLYSSWLSADGGSYRLERSYPLDAA